MRKYVIVALTSLSSMAFAQEEAIDCNNAVSTLEINQCAAIELEAAQKQLNKYLETSFEHNSYDPELIKAIQVAQKIGKRM